MKSVKSPIELHQSTKLGGLCLIALIATALLVVSPTFAQSRIGPSFQCDAPSVATQPLAQIICSSDDLASEEMRYVIAYQAFRHSLDDAGKQALARAANALVVSTTEACQLPTTGRVTSAVPSTTISCIKRSFDAARRKIIDRLTGDAATEANLTPGDALLVQQFLKEKGILPQDAVIDGVFGPATRAAISQYQRLNQLTATGYATRTMLASSYDGGKATQNGGYDYGAVARPPTSPGSNIPPNRAPEASSSRGSSQSALPSGSAAVQPPLRPVPQPASRDLLCKGQYELAGAINEGFRRSLCRDTNLQALVPAFSGTLLALRQLYSDPERWAQIRDLANAESVCSGNDRCIEEFYRNKLTQLQQLATGQTHLQDLIVYLNPSVISSGISKNLDGKLTVNQASFGDVCAYQVAHRLLQSSVYKHFAREVIRREISGLDIVELDVASCSSRGSAIMLATQGDLLGHETAQAPKSLQQLFQLPAYSFATYAENERQQTQLEMRTQANQLASLINGGMSGAGLLMVSRKENVCLLDDAPRVWAAALKKHLDEFQEKLFGSLIPGGAEETFQNLKLSKCGYAFGSASALGRIAAALRRDSIEVALNKKWLSEADIQALKDDIERENQRKIAEEKAAREKVEAENARKAAEEKAKEEAIAKCTADPICRQKREDEARQKAAEAERQQASERQRRERLGIVAITIYCQNYNGGRLFLIHCLSKDGQIKIEDNGSTKDYRVYELGRREVINQDLQSPWGVFVQTGGTSGVKLVIKATYPDGRTITKEAATYGIAMLP